MGKSEKTIESFKDIRNEYPDTKFISTGNAPIAAGKTLFAMNLAEATNGFSLSLDRFLFAEFCKAEPEIVKKITGVDPKIYEGNIDKYIFDNVLLKKKFYENYLMVAEKFIEKNTCAKIQEVIKNPKKFTKTKGINFTPAYKDTEIVFGTPLSKPDKIILDLSPMPESIQKSSTALYDINVPQAARVLAFIQRELADYRGKITPKLIKALTHRVMNVTKVEEKILDTRPKGDFEFNNSEHSLEKMKQKINEISEQLREL